MGIRKRAESVASIPSATAVEGFFEVGKMAGEQLAARFWSRLGVFRLLVRPE